MSESAGEGSHRELQALKDAEKEYADLPEDTWGAALYTLVKDLPDILGGEIGKVNVVRFIFVIAVLVLNLYLQFMILYWIKKFVMDPSMRTAQDNYKAYHEMMFDVDGNPVGDFSEFPHPQSLCQSALSNFGFITAILFLWAVTCLTEMRNIERLVKQFNRIPSLPEGESVSEMVNEKVTRADNDGNDDVIELLCLSKTTRFSIWLVIFLPKIGIVAFLTYTGMVWLTATQSFADLILNALALEFVINIDDVLYSSFFPKNLVDCVGKMKIANPALEESEKEDSLAGYWRSVYYLSIMFAFVIIYLLFLQPVLPGYSRDFGYYCSDFLAEELSPKCAMGSHKDCFPFGHHS